MVELLSITLNNSIFLVSRGKPLSMKSEGKSKSSLSTLLVKIPGSKSTII